MRMQAVPDALRARLGAEATRGLVELYQVVLYLLDRPVADPCRNSWSDGKAVPAVAEATRQSGSTSADQPRAYTDGYNRRYPG